MSMLAETRKQKRKGSFKTETNPRGDLWVKDDSKLGQKMLENMGWAKGDGLGKNKQGKSAALKAIANTGTTGLGHNNTDELETWSQHHDNFEDVLANLNSLNNGQSNSATEDDINKERKFSLENSSKESKARVHYHKFTRGKDLSSKNEDELACVTGSKKLKKKKMKTDGKELNDTEPNESEIAEPEHIVYGGNLQEYFNKKMSELSRKRSEGILAPAPDCRREYLGNNVFDLEFTPSKKEFSFSVDCKNRDEMENDQEEVESCDVQLMNDYKKKGKGAKVEKSSHCEINKCGAIEPYERNSINVKPFEGILNLFKKKKSKDEKRLSGIVEKMEEEAVECPTSPTLKLKKKRKFLVGEENDEDPAEFGKPKCKKSKKKRAREEEINFDKDSEKTSENVDTNSKISANEDKENSTKINMEVNNDEERITKDKREKKDKKKRKVSSILEESHSEKEESHADDRAKKLKRCASTNIKVDDSLTCDAINHSYISATQSHEMNGENEKELAKNEYGERVKNPMKKLKDRVSSHLNLGELFNSGKERRKKSKILEDGENVNESRPEVEEKNLDVGENQKKEKGEVWKKRKTMTIKSKDKTFKFDVASSFPGSDIFSIKGYPY